MNLKCISLTVILFIAVLVIFCYSRQIHCVLKCKVYILSAQLSLFADHFICFCCKSLSLFQFCKFGMFANDIFVKIQTRGFYFFLTSTRSYTGNKLFGLFKLLKMLSLRKGFQKEFSMSNLKASCFVFFAMPACLFFNLFISMY